MDLMCKSYGRRLVDRLRFRDLRERETKLAMEEDNKVYGSMLSCPVCLVSQLPGLISLP